MPRPTSFIDRPQASEKPYDFELIGPDRQVLSLTSKTELVATIKRQDTEITPRLESGFGLNVGRTSVHAVSTGEYLSTWLAYAELVDGRMPVVSIEVSRPGGTPLESEARLRYRLWLHHTGWAVFDPAGTLVLSFHPAWRDSEAARHVVGGFRLHVPLSDEDANVTAIAASLFWPMNNAVFR